MSKPTYLFHYTSEARLNEIVKSGELKVSRAALSTKKEKPALWLSAEPDWDNSALRFHHYKDKEEQWEAIGLGRIVVPFFGNFVTYAKWKHVSAMDPLFEEAERMLFDKYDRSKWWASFKNIPSKEFISTEYWDGQQWCYCENGTPSVYNVKFSNNNLSGGERFKMLIG